MSFDLSDRIVFNSDIISHTNAEIKFSMLDKNSNLLIFSKTKQDVQKLMECDDLPNSRLN